MQNPRKTQASWWDYLLLVALLITVIGIVSALYPQVGNIFLFIAPSCSVRIESATITVKGWSASSDCDAILAGPNNFTGDNWAKLGATNASEVDGNIQCELDIRGRHVIVRDSGTSSIGNLICGTLQGTYPGP